MRQRAGVLTTAGRWIPGFAISLLAILLLVKTVSWQEVGQALVLIPLGNFLLALFFFTAGLVTRAFAWQSLLQYRISLWKVFLALNEGFLLNNILPLRLGELGRAALLSQASGIHAMYILSTIVLERVLDLAAAAGMLLATLPAALGLANGLPLSLAASGIVFAGLGVLFFARRNRSMVNTWLEKATRRSAFLKRLAGQRLDPLLDGLGALSDTRQFWLAVFWIAVSWLFGSLEFYVLMRPVAPEAPMWGAALVLSVTAFGIALPSAPAALGVYEASAVGALALLGVEASAALALALVTHFIHFAVTGVLGVLALMREGETLSQLYHRVKRTT